MTQSNLDTLEFPRETQRLLIRPLLDDDFDAIYYLCTTPEVCRYIRPPISADAVRTRIQERSYPWTPTEGSWISLAVLEKGGGQVIGELVFRVESHVDHRLEIGYHFRPDSQGKGFAFEAVSELVRLVMEAFPEAHKLVAYCESENLPSRKLLTKLGMIEEGTRREHTLTPFGWADLVIYGLLRREWSDKPS